MAHRLNNMTNYNLYEKHKGQTQLPCDISIAQDNSLMLTHKSCTRTYFLKEEQSKVAINSLP